MNDQTKFLLFRIEALERENKRLTAELEAKKPKVKTTIVDINDPIFHKPLKSAM